MTERLVILVMAASLVAGFIGPAHTATPSTIQLPPGKPLPVPTTVQQSFFHPHPREVFAICAHYEEWEEDVSQGRVPEFVAKTHITSAIELGGAPLGPAPYECEGCYGRMRSIADKLSLKRITHFVSDSLMDINRTDPQKRPALLQATRVNIDGEGLAQQCTNNPVWREFLLEVARRSIAWGADGIYIDGWNGTFGSLYKDTPDAGCFCQYCMRGFNEYLKAKYSPEELRSFGIEDIDSFHYGNFIKEGYLALYNVPVGDDSREPVPLFIDFADYQMESITEFWRETIEQVKAYGTTQGKDVYFSANTVELEGDMVAIAEHVDYLIPEYTYGYPPKSRAIPVYQLGTSLSKPVVTFPHSATSRTAELMARSDATSLWRIYTAEAYSARGFALVPYGYDTWWTDPMTIFYPDLDELGPYYEFISTNKRYYENLVSTGRTAVLYSFPTKRWWTNNDFYGICNLLLDAHFQYDVLFAGDNDWIEDNLTLNELQGYEVVVLPSPRHLSDTQVSLLLSYVNSGGRIIAFGEIGKSSEKGRDKIERPELQSLLTEGIHNYGLGIFVYMPGQVGSDYLNTRESSNRQQFVQVLGSLIYPNIRTDASENVTMLEYWNSKIESIVLHLINYAYDLEKQQIKSQRSINVEVLIYEPLSGKELAVNYSSPDWVGVERLNYEVNGGRVKFTVPRLDYYGIVSVGKSPAMPCIPLLLLLAD